MLESESPSNLTFFFDVHSVLLQDLVDLFEVIHAAVLFIAVAILLSNFVVLLGDLLIGNVLFLRLVDQVQERVSSAYLQSRSVRRRHPFSPSYCRPLCGVS